MFTFTNETLYMNNSCKFFLNINTLVSELLSEWGVGEWVSVNEWVSELVSDWVSELVSERVSELVSDWASEWWVSEWVS